MWILSYHDDAAAGIFMGARAGGGVQEMENGGVNDEAREGEKKEGERVERRRKKEKKKGKRWGERGREGVRD